VVRQDLLHLGAHTQQLGGLDLNVGALTATLGVGLVDQNSTVRQGKPFARGTGGEQDCSGRSGLAEADSLDLRLNELHRVVDRRHGGV
jgi:hypothetical protein